MSDFDRAIAFVLRQEGGFVDDPRGGPTRFGISQKAHPAVDLAGLTRDGAVAIYARDYWQAARCDLLPWPLSLALFDGAVQHGVTTATRLLQQALRVEADGVVGPETHQAATAAPVRDVLADYLTRRAVLYVGIPTGPLRGWLRRLFDLALEAGEGRP